MNDKALWIGLPGVVAIAAVAAGVLVHKAYAPPVIKPLAVIAVKDCGHLLGVLIIDKTGEIHDMPGPFDTATKAGIAELAHKVPDQKKNLATIDMPCKAPSGDELKGTDT